MDIMTKVRVLWDKVAGIAADVSAVDAKATATAATLAGILPRIPADYSTEEVNTGVNFLTYGPIYKKVFVGNFSDDGSPSVIGSVPASSKLVNVYLMTGLTFQRIFYSTSTYLKQNGEIEITPASSGYYGIEVTCVIFYCKPTTHTRVDDPSKDVTNYDPEQEPETRKRKTTKKEEK